MLKKLYASLLIIAFAFGNIPTAEAAAVSKSNQLGQNLITFSEQMNNAAWVATNITVTANTTDTTDLVGSYTAEKLTASGTGTVNHYISVVATGLGSPPRNMTVSAYVKAGTARYVAVGSSQHTAFYRTWFDFNTNTISSSDAGVTGSAVPVGNGWYRVSASWLTPVGTGGPTQEDVTIAPTPSNTTVAYAQVGETVYAWRGQLVRGTLSTAYNPTTATALNSTFVPSGATKSNQLGQNLLTFSEQFNNAAWTTGFTNLPVTADATIAPNGTMTADKLTTTSSTSSSRRPVTSVGSSNGNTFSIFVKKGTGATVNNYFLLRDDTTATNNLLVHINFNTGAITYDVGSSGASMVNVGNGWWRLSLVVGSGISNGDNLSVYIGLVGNPTSNVGDFSYVWGAQLVKGISPAAYNPTTSVAINSTFVPSGVTKSSQLGQNLILRSEQFDNASWAKTNQAVITANAATAPDGSRTAESFSSTNTNANITQGIIGFKDATAYTGSVWLRADAATTTRIEVTDLTDGVPTSAVTVSLTTSWKRFSITGSGASGMTAATFFIGNRSGGFPVATTVYVWGAQVVQGTTPAAYNPTTASAINSSYVP